MDRKEIAALLAGCKPDEMMKFRDEGDLVVVIAPDGRKYKYTNEQLEAAASKAASKVAPKKRAARKPAKSK